MVSRELRLAGVKVGILRDLPAGEELESYQLVGAVTAHQGKDG